MCFRKRYGFSIRKCTGIGMNNAWNHPEHPSRYPRNLIQCHLLRAHSPRIYIRSLPNFLCPYLRACAFGKWWGLPSKMHGLGPKIHVKSPLSPKPVPQKLDSMPPSKGPFSANIHPIIPKLSVPIPEGLCFRKMVGGPLRKWMLRGQKSTSNHHKDSDRLLTNPLKVHFPKVISPRIFIWSLPTLLCV